MPLGRGGGRGEQALYVTAFLPGEPLEGEMRSARANVPKPDTIMRLSDATRLILPPRNPL